VSNPLLKNSELPCFSEILPKHIVPAVEEIIKRNLTEIDKLLDNNEPFSWDNLVTPLEVLDDALNKAWSGVSHMNSVVNSDELRQEYNKCLPKLAEYALKVGQNTKLFAAYNQIKQSPQFASFDKAQQKVITNALRDFKLIGVALPEDKRAKFSELKQKLTQLQSKFDENVLDATDNWHIDIQNQDKLVGVPQHTLDVAKETAIKEGIEGFRFGLDFPTYHAIITYCDNRPLRETFYKAFVTRASSQGADGLKLDNSSTMEEILRTRYHMAKLLDFDNYAHMSLATKMAKSPSEVIEFLTDLANQARPFAKKEFEELTHFAKQQGLEELQAWDMAYYSEKLKIQRFSISQEALRPYFPLPKVLSGMFEVISRLFGMQVKEQYGGDFWHEDVRFFEIYDSTDCLRGKFYLDLFARSHKRGGAWMDECRVRRSNGAGVQIPVAYLTCNFGKPAENAPALLTHEEVITLFHEFGHGLHHMLTKINYADVSGINGVPWDAVELPSQFLENWCWGHDALQFISGHYQTNEPLPEQMLAKLREAKNFAAGLRLLRQLEFSLFDFRLHNEYSPDQQGLMQKILDEVRAFCGVISYPKYNRFAHSFSHIFAGGYGAGYYSYLWAEVLSCDAFSLFEENGIFDKQTGTSFLTNILEKGGSQEPKELFENFRSREQSIEPFLRSHGLTDK